MLVSLIRLVRVCLTLLIINITIVAAIGVHYASQLCPGTVGPTHGDVLRYDPNAQQSSWAYPTNTLDCWITFRGQPTPAGGPQRYSTLTWRTSDFSMLGYGYTGAGANANNNTACATAYIEVYNATDSGLYIAPPAIGPVCGTSAPSSFTTTSQSIVVHIFVASQADVLNGVYTATPVTSATTAPASNVTSVTTAAATVTTAAISNITTASPGGPFINFTADFTSYFLTCTTDGTSNDGSQFQCTNGRCVDDSLRCDVYSSDNCGDASDMTSGPPANCSVIPTPTPDPLTTTLLPLWIVLASLVASAIAYWCCWRPGWCPWRLSRLRNATCCRGAACCQATGCCGPRAGCNCCSRTGSGFPESYHPTKGNMKAKHGRSCFPCANNSSVQDDPTAGYGGTGWQDFAYDDGAHVREIR